MNRTLPLAASSRIVVVGDVMVDRYWYGDAHRISQEAPVPVVDVAVAEDRPGRCRQRGIERCRDGRGMHARLCRW